MKRYIKSSTGNGSYIGGKLSDVDNYDLYDDEDLYYDALSERAEIQNNYIDSFADTYMVYRPKSAYHKFSLRGDSYLLNDLAESMAVKEGIDVVAYSDHIEIIAYYNFSSEIAYLYPISQEKASEISDIIDNSEFDETDAIEDEIAQYAWSGASIEDVLKSWA